MAACSGAVALPEVRWIRCHTINAVGCNRSAKGGAKGGSEAAGWDAHTIPTEN
jgi:hypothetical protein